MAARTVCLTHTGDSRRDLRGGALTGRPEVQAGIGQAKGRQECSRLGGVCRKGWRLGVTWWQWGLEGLLLWSGWLQKTELHLPYAPLSGLLMKGCGKPLGPGGCGASHGQQTCLGNFRACPGGMSSSVSQPHFSFPVSPSERSPGSSPAHCEPLSPSARDSLV